MTSNLLFKKRKRDFSNNDSSFDENLYNFKFNNSNSSQNNRSTNEYFQKLIESKNSKNFEIIQNNFISPLFNTNYLFNSFCSKKSGDIIEEEINGFSNNKQNFLNNSFSSNKISPPKYLRNDIFIFSPSSSFNLKNHFNFDEFLNNNYLTKPIIDFNQLVSQGKNNKDNAFTNKNNDNSNNPINSKNININFIKNVSIENNEKNIKDTTHFTIKREFKSIFNNKKHSITKSLKNEINQNQNNKTILAGVNTSLFKTQNKMFSTKNNITPSPSAKINTANLKSTIFISNINDNIKNDNNNPITKNITISTFNTVHEATRPFQTFNAKFVKSKDNSNKFYNNKSNQEKIFHIEKIFNKKEYKDANEKEFDEDDIYNNNRYKITLKKIEQIYKNSCLKIYLYINDKLNFNEINLSNESYLNNIYDQVFNIIKKKKINSSKMNEILQVNDDDKYRKHYFMFTPEAKQFCLDLINKEKLSFDIVMKMCKVPRKSLRRWFHVGCNRKKGCGRKTRNPEMESKLVEWYNETIGLNVNVSAKMIREKAVEISEDKEFLASKGWLEKFKKKFGIKINTHFKKNKKFKGVEKNGKGEDIEGGEIKVEEGGKKPIFLKTKVDKVNKDKLQFQIINVQK